MPVRTPQHCFPPGALINAVGSAYGPLAPGSTRPDLTEMFFLDRKVPPFPSGGLGHALAGRMADYLRWEDRRFDVLG
jgi:hypothetical protein